MPKAEVYYHSASWGHVGVNIVFSENEVPARDKYHILIYSKHNPHNPSKHWEKQCKLYARRSYYPAVFLHDNGEYSVYGYKDGFWQETPLNILLPEERAILQSLSFAQVLTQENDEYFHSGYQDGSWQKISLPKDCIHLSSSYEFASVKPADLLYKLMQKGHPTFKRTEYFFDWGGTYDFEENRINRGEPIRISLASTEKSFIEFFTEIEKSEYCYTEPPLNSTYRLFTKNCAHATMEVLYYAGYLEKKPINRFALAPITIATKACELAKHSRNAFRKQLMESVSKTDTKQLINTLIELSINRLHDNIHFNYGKYIGGCSQELESLSKIKYDSSYESIERLLKFSEEASRHTAKELEDCIALIDPEVVLNVSIARLESVANDLKSKENAARLQTIATKLRSEFTNFKEKAISHEEFTQNCSTLINEAEPILKKENSISLKILKNIGLAVCGLVVLYLVAGFINKANSGDFLFFSEPRRSKIGTEIQNNISKLSI